MQPLETYEHAGIPIEIHYDEDAEHANPRDCDNVTTMVCWHPDYVLGDMQIRDGAGRGAVETPFGETWKNRGSFNSMEHLRRYLTLCHGAVGIRPLYLLDHSGLSIRAGSPSLADPGGWDTTMCGFVYCTHERLTELCGEGPKYHTDEWIAEVIKQDVSCYDDYLRGAVYGYVVARGTEDEESCWGFLGDPDAEGGLKNEANAVAEQIARDRFVNQEPTDVAEVLAALAGRS